MGETAARFLPWPSGKDSKGNRLGIGFLWRLSFPQKKAGRRRHPPGRVPAGEVPPPKTKSKEDSS